MQFDPDLGKELAEYRLTKANKERILWLAAA
jgi:hypothetical protein